MSGKSFLFFTYVVLIVTVMGCGAKAAGGAEGDDKPAAAIAAVELATVESKTIRSTILAQGVVVASQGASVKLGAVSAGRIDAVFVKEGDHVQAGQLVAILDNRLQKSQTTSASASFAVAQSQLKQSALTAKFAEADHQSALTNAESALKSSLAERTSAVKQAQLDLDVANLELRKAMLGGRPQEVAQAEQIERQAQVTKDSAERDEKRNALLFEKGIVSQKAYEDSRVALANAVASLTSAQSQLSLVKEGPRAEDKQAAKLKAEAAKAALTTTIEIQNQRVRAAQTAVKQAEQGKLLVQEKLQELAASEGTVSQKSADALAAKASQDLFEVRSSISGFVTKRMLNPGDTPDNNSAILEVVSPDAGLDLVASVPVSNGALLHVGQSALISIPNTSDIVVNGGVTNIGQVDPITGLQSVRIKLSDSPAWLKPGTFATAKVVLKEHKNALTVPKSAVLSKDGASIVYVAKDDKAVLTKVELGAEEDESVDVLKGLKAGDKVVSLGNYELSDGAAIKIAVAEDTDKKTPDAKGEAGSAKPGADDEKKAVSGVKEK